MDTQEFQDWNGFKVKGDTAELDAVINNPGFINLDLRDIETTFHGEGENRVIVATGSTVGDTADKLKRQLVENEHRLSKLALALKVKGDIKMEEVAAIRGLVNNDKVHLTFGYFKVPEQVEPVKIVAACKFTN